MAQRQRASRVDCTMNAQLTDPRDDYSKSPRAPRRRPGPFGSAPPLRRGSSSFRAASRGNGSGPRTFNATLPQTEASGRLPNTWDDSCSPASFAKEHWSVVFTMGWWFLSVPILSKNIEASTNPRNFLPYLTKKWSSVQYLTGACRVEKRKKA